MIFVRRGCKKMTRLGVERVLEKEPPDVVLVQSDTNTVLACASPQ